MLTGTKLRGMQHTKIGTGHCSVVANKCKSNSPVMCHLRWGIYNRISTFEDVDVIFMYQKEILTGDFLKFKLLSKHAQQIGLEANLARNSAFGI